MTKFTMGCDPEFYCVDEGTNQPISAHELVPGTKSKPHKLPSGGHVQADGVAVEFNIPPSTTGKEFADNIEAALNDVRKMVPNKYLFTFMPYVQFGRIYFESLPPAVKELGCDPDYDSHNHGTQRQSPGIHASAPYRCFGGHLHFGWGENMEGSGHLNDCVTFINGLEAVKSGILPYFDEAYSAGVLRQRIYGANGSFRPKSYGVEWRSPDNTWLATGRDNWAHMFNYFNVIFTRMTSGNRSLHTPVPPPRAKASFVM